MNKRQTKSGFLIFPGLLVSLFWLISPCIYGQKENIRFKSISLEEGLSQSAIYCIHQDSKGFMWFGTQDGLNRYDGYEFKVYKNNPQDQKTISDIFILAIYED